VEELTEFSPIFTGEDVKLYCEAYGKSTPMKGTIRGEINRKPQVFKTCVFATLDSSAGLQIIFSDSDQYASAKKFKIGDKLEVRFVSEETDNGVRLKATSFKRLPTRNLYTRSSPVTKAQFEARSILAEIAHKSSEYLRSNNWKEIVPQTISADRDSTLEPLSLVFPGLGAEAKLEISPLAQVIEFAQAMNDGKVFARGRIFNRAIRDGYTSPEEPVICGVMMDHIEGDQRAMQSLSICLKTSEELIKAALAPYKFQMSRKERNWFNAVWLDQSGVALSSISPTKAPIHEIISNNETDGITIYRTVWPSRTIVVEGHCAIVNDCVYSSFTLHCERVVSMLSETKFRRLQIGPKPAYQEGAL